MSSAPRRDLHKVAHSYQWFRAKSFGDWKPIEGATEDSLVPLDEDAGYMLKVGVRIGPPGEYTSASRV